MIAWLNGRIAHKGVDALILDVNGVGYELQVSLRALERLPPVGDQAAVHVYTNVREDAIQLYGFHDPGSKRMFTELIGISGVGPKMALSALGVYDAAELRGIILDGDITRLTRISGVGKKTAQRVVLELSQKLKGVDIGGGDVGRNPQVLVLEDLRSALVNLGYSAAKTDGILLELEPAARDNATLEELLKQALALIRA